MKRIHRTSFIVPHEPYRLIKRFRHNEELGYEPEKWHKNIYNKNRGEFFGSTPMRWLTRCIFFAFFYAGICLLWYILWLIFRHAFIYTEKPNYYAQTAPGISLAPHLGELTFPVIEFRERKQIDIDPYIDEIDKFLTKYGPMNEDFGECTADKEYGYMKSTPCFFLKLNRIQGFTARTYNSEAELPNFAPIELKSLVKSLPAEQKKNRVWISCTAERPGITKLEYWPKHQSVPAELLTVSEKEVHGENFYTANDYKRIIAVQISGFNITERFRIACFTWAANIPQLSSDGYSNRGFLKFAVHVKKALLFSYD